MTKLQQAAWDGKHIECVIYSGKTTIIFYYDGRQVSYFDRPRLRKRFDWWHIRVPYDTDQCKLLTYRYNSEISANVLRQCKNIVNR